MKKVLSLLVLTVISAADDDVKNPARPASALGLQVLSTLGVGLAAKW